MIPEFWLPYIAIQLCYCNKIPSQKEAMKLIFTFILNCMHIVYYFNKHATEISIILLTPTCKQRIRSLNFRRHFHYQHLQEILLIYISYRFLPGTIAQEFKQSFNSHLPCLVKCMLPQCAIAENLLCCTVMLSATSPLPATGLLKLKINSYLVGYKLSCGLKTEENWTAENKD